MEFHEIPMQLNSKTFTILFTLFLVMSEEISAYFGKSVYISMKDGRVVVGLFQVINSAVNISFII